MKLFLDSADVNEIKQFADLKIIDGVTTNPTLIQKSGRNYKDVLKEICSLVHGPVSAEVVATETKKIIEEGMSLSKIAENIIIKLPCNMAGLRAATTLIENGKKINVTLCFSAAQAVMASKVGVDYVSVFIGRLEDIGFNGASVIGDIRTLYDNLEDNSTEILAASVRSVEHFLESIRMGADAVTVAPKILHQMFNHPLTDQGIEIFLKDWAATKQEIV